MRGHRWKLFVTGGLVTLSGCHPSVTSTQFRQLTPLSEEIPVELYSAAMPECPFDEVGLVSSNRPNPWTSMDEVLAALVRRARVMGGDAIVGLRETPPRGGDTVIFVASSDENTTSRTLSGTVIRFRDASCRH
jgi:hypothetical protein